MIEQALYITTTDHLRYMHADVNRLYFGQEFCERLLPAVGELREMLAYAAERGLSFSLVTPVATDSGLATIEQLMRLLNEELTEAEVVFNDWGVFHLLQEQFPACKPVMGRLLNKQKRGPRIMNIIDKVPEPTRRYYQGSNLDVPAAAAFLKQLGINRVEFDNLLQDTDFNSTDLEIHKSLYLPFAFVSTTRFCLTAGCAQSENIDRIGVYPCGKECRQLGFALENPVMQVPLIRKGNTVFIVNEHIPDCIAQNYVDRIVVQPELPL
ncbi:hypothetical protein ACFL43_00625 [Thermodesulfobacteriota bacterium]